MLMTGLTIAGVEHDGPRFLWMLLEVLYVRPDRETFIVSEMAVVVKFNLPAPLLILGLRGPVNNLVANNLDVVCLRPDQVDQQPADDRRHAAAQHNHRDLSLARPLVELLEVWIKLYILTKKLDAFRKRDWHTIEHVTE